MACLAEAWSKLKRRDLQRLRETVAFETMSYNGSMDEPAMVLHGGRLVSDRDQHQHGRSVFTAWLRPLRP